MHISLISYMLVSLGDAVICIIRMQHGLLLYVYSHVFWSLSMCIGLFSCGDMYHMCATVDMCSSYVCNG